MVKRFSLLVLLAACAPPAPPLDPAAIEGQPALNPILHDGRLVYRAFGDHHPTCFAFVGDSRDTEDVPCPDGAIELLAACPGGKLVRQRTQGCACVPEDGSAPASLACPTSP